MDNYKFEYCKLDNVLEKIENDGIAVIKNIINEEEINKCRKMMWDILNELTINLELPITKDDKKSWNSFYKLKPEHNMMIHKWNIGHNKLSWYLRQHKNVLRVFSKIWNVKENELLTSFDGLSIHFPPEITNIGFNDNNKDWFHTDQSRNKKELSCIQGMMTLYDINEGDATLSCYKESNKLHKLFFEKNKNIKSTSDWYLLNEKDKLFFNKLEIINIKAEKGSLILWDSRTFHQGLEPFKKRKKQNMRCVIYLCMTPRILASNTDLKKKRKAFRTKRTTSHWPHKTWVFTKKTNIKDIKHLNVNNNHIKDIGYKLSGF